MKHKIIQTENYLLIVDDSEIKLGDYFYDNDEELCKYTFNYIVTPNKWDDNKKIIAHLPLNNSPILDGVNLLPPLEDDEVDKLAVNNANDFYEKYRTEWEAKKNGFIDGYNKAKEKYKYTEEDMIKCWKYAIIDKHQVFGDQIGDSYMSFIQSLQQPKMPIEFECEIDNILSYNVEDGINALVNPNFGNQKTIINSQGLTQWVGKYIFD
jgi:hypothetical protein